MRQVFSQLEVEHRGLDISQKEYGFPVLIYIVVFGHTLVFGLNSFAAFTHDKGVCLLHTFLNDV